MFVDIKDGEESSQVNCQNSNAADEARDRTPIAQLELHWRASVRQELQVGKQVTSRLSLETVLSGPEPDSAGTITRAISRDQPGCLSSSSSC